LRFYSISISGTERSLSCPSVVARFRARRSSASRAGNTLRRRGGNLADVREREGERFAANGKRVTLRTALEG